MSILLGLSLNSCWDKQDHSITRPEVPRYTLTGSLVDMDDTAQPVASGRIIIRPIDLHYEVSPVAMESASDSVGMFQIDSVVPGNYIVELFRDGYKVAEREFSMNYESTSRIYGLPKPLVSTNIYPMNFLTSNPRISWSENTLYVFGEFVANFRRRLKIYFCELRSENDQINVTGQVDNRMPGADIFFNVGQYFYAGNSTTVKRYKKSTGELVEEITVTEPFSGLAWDGTKFWSVHRSKLQYRGKDPATVTAEYDVDTGILSNLTAAGENFWTCNPTEDVLFKINRQGEILATYHPVEDGQGLKWITTHDLYYSTINHQLWISNSMSKVVYSFRDPNL
ncbi:MAG: carboxypeptidase-like regulatory domain-containing protein [Candidatus Marinimicrobia bacterium]|nr:carboxypeptidase-like regulatory domain-containing protein [Candidatus Neomarinimicrobiota bacterium]MCF7829425.1 carboxypeptidase-like regulatory domain-containing protein [Candidatus Neomarinimicrobiota bacterium]MCF7880911.1 carboxypeptidase-like regulatory domain-containing protein [Candidatus Neomarinimicrobiota bacterium]